MNAKTVLSFLRSFYIVVPSSNRPTIVILSSEATKNPFPSNLHDFSGRNVQKTNHAICSIEQIKQIQKTGLKQLRF